MANIVFSTFNPMIDSGGCFPYIETMVKELANVGNNVLFFQTRVPKQQINQTIPSEYLEKIKKFNPDVFIFVNNQFWDISHLFDCPIIIWDVDSPNVYANIEQLKNANGRYKYCCITTSGVDVIDDVIHCGKKNILYVPPFTGIQSERSEQNINIAFCGSHWLWNDFNQIQNFLEKNPNQVERELAEKVYNDFIKQPFYPAEYFYEKYNKTVQNKLDFGNLYFYSARVSGVKRLNILNAIKSLGLEIRGKMWTNSIMLSTFPELLLHYSSDIVNDTETTQDFYNSAKIGFNTNHIQAKDGFSFRVCDILASNACLVTQYSKDFENLGFKNPTYNTPQEAYDICQMLLKNKSMRQDLVLSAHEIIDKNHRFIRVLPMLEHFVGVTLHDNKSGNIEFISIPYFDDSQTTNASMGDFVYGKKNKFLNKIEYKIWTYLSKYFIKHNIFILKNCKNYIQKVLWRIWNHYNKSISKTNDVDKNVKSNEFRQFIRKNNNKLLDKLRVAYKTNKKVKVAFLHMYATSVQDVPIFDKMLKSDVFDPYWIVNPDVSRSKENFDKQYQRTKEILVSKYGPDRVLDGYNYEKDLFIDYTDMFDMATTSNPYDLMAQDKFKITYWATKMPMFYIPYFYMGRCFITIKNLKDSPQINYFWKIFSENDYVKKLARQYQALHGENIVVTGYPKLDEFAEIKKKVRKRKCVILAPHHTIDSNETSVGAFLTYYSDLLELPNKFPQIDFVYRPHPLLEERLKKLWGKERYDEYMRNLLNHKNIRYSTEGEYQELFINSDALIHDCGSFSAEYLCTGHPAAYWFKPTANYDKIHTELGNKCIENHYLIKTKQDLFDFIDNVVIGGNDTKEKERINFAKNELMVNFPNATDTIINYLNDEIMKEDKK